MKTNFIYSTKYIVILYMGWLDWNINDTNVLHKYFSNIMASSSFNEFKLTKELFDFILLVLFTTLFLLFLYYNVI